MVKNYTMSYWTHELAWSTVHNDQNPDRDCDIVNVSLRNPTDWNVENQHITEWNHVRTFQNKFETSDQRRQSGRLFWHDVAQCQIAQDITSRRSHQLQILNLTDA